MKIFLEEFALNIYYIDKTHEMKHRYVLNEKKYKKIQADISCVCAAKSIEPLKTIKKEIDTFELPIVKIAPHIMQSYESSADIVTDKKVLCIKMSFMFFHVKEHSMLSQKDIWIIQNHLEQLRQSLWEIILL